MHRLSAAVITLTCLSALLASPLSAVAGNDGFAGTAYTFYPLPPGAPTRPLLPLMRAAGSRWERLDFPWPQLEPAPGQWSWTTQDALVQDVHQAGLDILGVLLWTPTWAAEGSCNLYQYQQLAELRRLPLSRRFQTSLGPQSATFAPCATRPPRGLSQAWNDWSEADGDPANYWGRFAYGLASRYRSQIRHWEVWNEPDLTWFWSGSPAEYARLLQVAYQAIKSACPECRVLFGGLAFYANPDFYRRAFTAIANDPAASQHDYFFDALSLHLYSRPSSIVDVTNVVRADMRQRLSVERPIWLTETGVPVWDDFSVNPGASPYIWSARQTEAASFVLQSFANARLMGMERYIFFRAHDDWCDKNGNGTCADDGPYAGMREMYGLVRDNLSTRPAYTAYQLATQYLISPTWVSYWNYTGGGRRVSFWGTPRGKVSALWNTQPTTTTVVYPLVVPTATLIAQDGYAQVITPDGGGNYVLLLPGATANNGLSNADYIIGGRTYLLIEHDTDSPTAQLLEVTPTGVMTFTVRWTGADATSGVWRYDVQHRASSESAWTAWLTRTQATTAVLRAPQPDAHCFRVRAWDRVGQLSDWTPAQCATLQANLQLTVSVVFGDQNRNGIQDLDETTVTSWLRLRDAQGAEVVSPTLGSQWAVSLTLPLGDYRLEVSPQEGTWLPAMREIGLWSAAESWSEAIALLPKQGEVFVPLVQR